MRFTWLVVLVLLIAIAPEAVVGAAQAVVSALTAALRDLVANGAG